MADEQNPPDIYTDQVGMLTTEWGVILTLNAIIPTLLPESVDAAESGIIRQNVRLPVELRGILRMSHAHAKTLAILMKRGIKAFEEQYGDIPIPQPVIDRHNITPEDWE